MKQILPRSIILATLALLVFSNPSWANEEFPGRVKYPRVPVITKHELKATFNTIVVVDARSKLEFKTLRINGAKNIPIGSLNFSKQIKKLRN